MWVLIDDQLLERTLLSLSLSLSVPLFLSSLFLSFLLKSSMLTRSLARSPTHPLGKLVCSVYMTAMQSSLACLLAHHSQPASLT